MIFVRGEFEEWTVVREECGDAPFVVLNYEADCAERNAHGPRGHLLPVQVAALIDALLTACPEAAPLLVVGAA